ncbi:mucosa-associated lymphoid tissue lymphoma translocation protein 1 isoform X2 [Ambystoma mexicanum]|uniref:mucosa-associated lymphoid tissue lymphoma translocation protein 1 isoform X2 n=1 Tax=Ambystoma mexicanum TaxID=8296 RepID=UPI0037E94543
MSDTQQLRSLNINQVSEPVRRKVAELLDESGDRGWRRLAELLGVGGRCRLSPLELEHCSLKVLESEGSPSLYLLRLMGEKGYTAMDLVEFLQTLGHNDGVQLLKATGIRIVVQPGSMAVLSGQRVKLCCLAVGHPIVQYQWFKVKHEVPHGNGPELVLNPVHVEDSGFYICRVNCGTSFEFSQWAQLDVCSVSAAGYGSVAGAQENQIHICVQPQSQKLIVGDQLVLECFATGKPLPRYQWYKNQCLLKAGNTKHYKIPYVTKANEGVYLCRVYNEHERKDSQEVEVSIEEHPTNARGPAENSEATDKVALLIGNMSYWNHPQLKAPMVDVYEMTNLLRQLDFKVVSLLDLTEPEMRNAVDEFLLLLDKGVYGLLYYAGHGYENYGNSFMVPVDAPNPYRSANCLCVQSILKLMQEKETGLNVFLLDMCRKRNEYDNTILIMEALRVTANIVFGYATCQGAEAFEIQQSGLANGIFMKFLKERLLEDKKITVLLDGVAEDMGKCHLTRGKQALEIRSSLSEKRALTDPIQQAGCSAESLTRNLQWAKAHELPESMCFEFDCGAQIQLGFAAEFSNVMIIYTRIVQKPPEIVLCEAYVTDFPLDLDIDPKVTNKGTPEETGSYLVSKELPKHCLYTRLSSLQKLQEPLAFSVCLRYQYQGMEETVEESKEVDVGKPLIANLDISSQFKRSGCLQTCQMTHSPCGSCLAGTDATEPQLRPQNMQYSGSHLNVYNPSLASASGFPQSEHFQYSVYSNALGTGQWSPYYSSYRSSTNIPVENTDDTSELVANFSDRVNFQ